MEEHEYRFALYMGLLYIQLVTINAATYEEAEYKLWDYLTERKISPMAIDLLHGDEIEE